MPRALALASAAVIAALALSACTTPAPEPTASPTASPEASGGGAGAGTLPGCDAVEVAVADLVAGLAYDEAVSTQQTAPEAYEQRVCVFLSPDGATQLGVTIAAIPFLETELELYGQMPGAIADERTADGSAVLQALNPDDVTDGHLDSALYLFDLTHSITIQGYSTTGELATALPALTVPAATEAAFAVRGLL